MTEQKTITIGGREIIAFTELTEYGSNHIISVTPIPIDGSDGVAWTPQSAARALDVWGVQSTRGQRIATAYENNELPCHDVDKLNRVLRPDEFENP